MRPTVQRHRPLAVRLATLFAAFALMTALLGMGSPALAEASGPIPGLVAHYTFDNNDGADSSGNGRNGTLVGSPTFAPGPAGFGNAFQADLGKYVVLPSTSAMSLYNHDFTVSAWVDATAFSGLGGYGGDWAVLGNSGPGLVGSGGLHLVLRDGYPYMGFFGNDIGSGTHLSLNTWYHITWRYTVAGGEMALFLNGAPLSSGGGHPPFIGTGNTLIGRCCETWDSPRYAKGAIDDVQIYDRALTAAEIATLTTPAAPPPPPVVVYTSGSDVDTWNPIFPASIDGSWPSTVCVPTPAVGLGAAWTNPHKASSFGTGAHPWQGGAGFTANWINAWGNLSSTGAGGSGHSWTKYSAPVTGNGSFVLNLLADNCSWIYLDGVLVGFQDASLSPRTYPVTLSGSHRLEFIIFDGGGLAGGMYRLETNTGAVVFPDTDDDGLTDPQEHLYGTDPRDPDSDDDGVSDGDEVAAGTNPKSPPAAPTTTTVTFGPGPFVYSGSAFTATASVSPAAAGAATIAYSGDCTNTGSTCQATATFAGSTGYLPSSATASITIDKAPPTTTVTFGPGPFVYTGSAFTATATVSPAAAGTATIAYTGDCTNGGSSCTATATYAESANYLGSNASASITITYVFCGFKQPLLVPVQEFKTGSTIPVKFCVQDASGASVSTVTGTVEAYVDGVLKGTVAFRFSDGQYIANVQTKDGKTNWPTGELELRVKLNDGTTHSTNALSTAGVKGGLKLK